MKKLLLILFAITPICAVAQRIVTIAPEAIFTFDPLTSKYVSKSLPAVDTYVKAWRDEGNAIKLVICLDSLNWASRYYVNYVDTTLLPRIAQYLGATIEPASPSAAIAVKIYDFPVSKSMIAHFEHDIQSIKRFFATPIIVLDSVQNYDPFYPCQFSTLIHNFQTAAANVQISVAAIQTPAVIPKNIYISTIKSIFPFDNQLVTIQISGAELKQLLENRLAKLYKTVRNPNDSPLLSKTRHISMAGVTYVVDLTQPPYKKIVKSTLIADSMYKIAINSFDAQNYSQIQIGDYKTLLINYLRSATSPQSIEKWVIIPQRWAQIHRKNYLQIPLL